MNIIEKYHSIDVNYIEKGKIHFKNFLKNMMIYPYKFDRYFINYKSKIYF